MAHPKSTAITTEKPATTIKSATPNKIATKKAPANYLKYEEMIKMAIVALKEHNGSSCYAIKKYIKANFNI
ncbi:hypothetical protein BC936DRAFT_150052, partial [Jimgerdemannia flammicorona]